jgi:LysM repeat protein
MFYTIKSGDTIGKLAKKFNVPISSLIAFNNIENADQIFVGQQIKVPNLEDVPTDATFALPTLGIDLVTKARTAINSQIAYRLGAGGMSPKQNLPAQDGYCDCSGFICWVLGLSRNTDIPYYKAKAGGWIYTDSIEADIKSPSGIFERLDLPELGCIVVYGAGDRIGHVGLVSEVSGGKMKKVIHCSSGNSRKYGNKAIQETAATVFNRVDALFGRFVG